MLEKYYNEEHGAIFKHYDKVLDMIKATDPYKYEWIYQELYILINSEHFNEELLQEATEKMINDNSTYAPKWTVAETTQVAKSNGITFEKFNCYDWNYVMNMVYSDYCEVLKDNLMNYVNMSLKFLEDKDAPKGKALKYYFAMKKCCN